MQIIWSPTALAQLAEIRKYIEQERPEAARSVAARIVGVVDQLTKHPNLGRPGRAHGTRELVIAGTPYVIPYRILGGRLRILAVFHGARRWPRRF